MDPISPELVLVDPELAREARARLGDPGKSNGTVPLSPIPRALPRPRIVGAGAVAASVGSTARLPIVPLREAEVASVATEARPHHVVRPKLLVVAVGLVGFILGVLLPPIGTGDDPGPSQELLASREARPASVIPRSITPTASSVRSDPRKRKIQAEIAQATQSAGSAPAKPKEGPHQSKPSEPATSPSTGRRRGAHETTRGQLPTRLFVWLPSRGAHYYHVQFLKGTRTIFEAWPTDPRVTVPLRGTFRGRRFAFANGRYRWIVRPAFGPRSEARYGEPIVRSAWVVRP
jgi:hypothetical protein